MSNPFILHASSNLTGYYFDFVGFLRAQEQWSQATFGPNKRTDAILDHIKREVEETRPRANDLSKWMGIALLAFDGARRQGFTHADILDGLADTLAKNQARAWPDWRQNPDGVIEHIREGADHD